MEKLLKAINFATGRHINQKRKDGITPLITHPLAVALILQTVTQDSDVIVAGILHDVLEDTETSKDELENIFGERIAQMVLDCTEANRSLSWKLRKEAVRRKIKKISYNSALIKTADSIHNLYELNQSVKEKGLKFFRNFHAGPKEKFAHEQKLFNQIKKYHDNPLMKEFGKNLDILATFVK